MRNTELKKQLDALEVILKSMMGAFVSLRERVKKLEKR